MYRRWSIAVFFVLAFTKMGNGQSDGVVKGHCSINRAEQASTYLNYGEAIQYYEAGIELFSSELDETHPLVAINYAALGRTFLEIGDNENASLYCTKALNNIRQSFPNGAIEAECLQCLGLIAQAEKKYSQALASYEKALAINNQLWGENHAASSQVYLWLGNYYLEQQEYGAAKTYYEKIKKLNQDESDSEQQQFLGKYHQAIGQWYFMQNNLDEAIIHLNKSLSIYKNSNGEKHPSVAQVHLRLGKVYAQKRAFREALEQYHLVQHSFQDYKQKNIEIEGYDTCRCNSVLIEGILGKAKTFEALFEVSGHQKDLIQALQHYQQAAKKVSLSVQFFAKTVQHRQQIIHQNKAIFVSGISLSHRLFELTKDKRFIREAFNLINNYKALTLQIKQKETMVMRGDVPESVLEEQGHWERKIANLEFEIYQTELKDEPNIASKKQALLEARIAQGLFLQAFKDDYWYVEDSIFNNDLADFSAIPSQLNDESVLLNYVVNDLDNQLFVIAFTKEQTHFFKIDLPSSFSKDVLRFHRLLQSSLLARIDKKQQFVQKGHSLYQHLVEPLSAILANKKRLIIIRDDVLHLLPFEVLLQNDELNDFEKLDYLIRDFEIIYHYSTGLWCHSQAQQWQGEANSLLAFAPVFDGSPSVDLSGQNEAFRCFVQDEVQVPLPYSEKEVTAIKQILNTTQSAVLLRENATKRELIAQLAKPYRFIHIASHSFANYDNAAFSGVACFIEKKIPESSCMLYINEIENLDIQADLVVLSSCESGIGQLLKGEGLLGINRSFLYAGVPNTLFSLWKVQDAATASLVIAFYKNIQQNKPYAEALQQAKLKVLQNPQTASPIFWASFILIGR